MQTSHSSLIRGLNIAVVVLSALSLIASVAIFSFLANSKDMIYDYVASDGYYTLKDSLDYDYDYDYLDDLWDDYDYGHHGDRYHTGLHQAQQAPSAISHTLPADYYDYSYYLDEDDIVALDIMFGIIDALLIWEMIASAGMLVFGILGLVRAGKPEKLGQVMVFGIIGAVLSFFAGHIILTVLFIISAVMANKDKNEILAAPIPPAEPPHVPPQVPPQGTYPF